MNDKHYLHCWVGVITLLFLLVACGGPPQTPTVPLLPSHTSTPALMATLPPTPSPTVTPTVVPEEPKAEWVLMTFGDSRTGWAHWPNTLSDYIEEDLDVAVKLKNRGSGGQISTELLDDIRDSDYLREYLSEAEMVLILTIDHDGYAIVGFNDYERECSTLKYEALLEDIVKEIIALREPNPLALRLLEHYNFPGIGDATIEGFDIRKACFEKYNASIHAVADRYGIPVVPVYEAFNGPDGDDNPDEKGYLSDGLHLAQPGDKVIADLVREIGYEPIGQQ